MNLLPTPKTRTAGQTLRFALAKAVATTGVMGIVLMGLGAQGSVTTVTGDGTNGARPDAKGSPSALMADNDCWTGEAPKGVTIPGHVVIRFEGEVSATLRGERAVGIALDHIFTEANPRVAEVVGFCR